MQDIILMQDSPKFNILPIGLENSMWNNTNILILYEIMSKSYNLKKMNNLYYICNVRICS